MKSDSITRYAIGLGSNLGDRVGHLRTAVNSMDPIGEVSEVSPLYETAPVGGPSQDPYLNAVVLVDSELAPEEVLVELNKIESDASRERGVRWGPRTLDLDIITSDGNDVSTDDLVIPHPRAAERVFVLQPLSDVWPHAPVGRGLTAAAALEDLDHDGVDRLLTNWVAPPRWHGPALVAGQLAILIAAAVGMTTDGTLPDGDATVARVVGAVVAVVGAFLAFVSSRRLGTGLTPDPRPKSGAVLVTSGPFRLARHPVYGGVCLLLIGTALLLDSLWGLGFAVLLIPYFLVKATFEERYLRVAYAAYAEYMSVVPRRLIPFLI